VMVIVVIQNKIKAEIIEINIITIIIITKTDERVMMINRKIGDNLRHRQQHILSRRNSKTAAVSMDITTTAITQVEMGRIRITIPTREGTMSLITIPVITMGITIMGISDRTKDNKLHPCLRLLRR